MSKHNAETEKLLRDISFQLSLQKTRIIYLAMNGNELIKFYQ